MALERVALIPKCASARRAGKRLTDDEPPELVFY